LARSCCRWRAGFAIRRFKSTKHSCCQRANKKQSAEISRAAAQPDGVRRSALRPPIWHHRVAARALVLRFRARAHWLLFVQLEILQIMRQPVEALFGFCVFFFLMCFSMAIGVVAAHYEHWRQGLHRRVVAAAVLRVSGVYAQLLPAR
jgi:hypothetical protein